MFKPREMTFPDLPEWSNALCPLDGRYRKVAKVLGPYFGEPGLMGYRISVEVAWLRRFIQALHPEYDSDYVMRILDEIESMYGEDVFKKIKDFEAETKHDVKAVEYEIDYLLRQKDLEELIPYVHIGCTSEDINNIAYALMWKDAINEVILPKLADLMKAIAEYVKGTKDIPMLARTHGQAASPTTMGKEYANFLQAFMEYYEELRQIVITGKFNGATGNYSALTFAYPDHDWEAEARAFVEEDMGLKMNEMTTQIEPHDFMTRVYDVFNRISLKLEKLDVDTWMYISYEMISQKYKENEVGSSTMAGQVNPITLENSEGHNKLVPAYDMGYSMAMLRSRMQRDLSDSCVERYGGITFGLLFQAMSQTIVGMGKISPNEEVLAAQLEEVPQVLAEPIQTLLRAKGYVGGYEELKKLTRGKKVTMQILHEYIISKDVFTDEERNRLLALTPATYTGKAPELAEKTLKRYEAIFAA